MIFKKYHRITFNKDFLRLKNLENKINCGQFILLWNKRKLEKNISRLGLIVSSKVGNSVKRNKIKRTLREIFRMNYDKIIGSIDIIIIARSSLIKANYNIIEKKLLKSIHLLNNLKEIKNH